MSVASVTNHFLEGSTSENGFHLPRINSYSATPRPMSRVSSLGEMVDKYNNDKTDCKHERKQEFIYRSRRTQAEDFGSTSASSFHNDVKAVYAPDINKVSMPIFGSRPPTSTLSVSVDTYRNHGPSAHNAHKIDIDEYLLLLKDKVRISYHEIKTKFRNADPDGKGGVTKEALAHILAAILGQSKPLSHSSYLKLLERMELKNKQFIKFEDFASSLQVNKIEFTPEWIDPVRAGSSVSSYKQSSTQRAGHVFTALKERAQFKSIDLVSLVGDGMKKIFKPELLNTINSMSMKMDSEEFEKLWKKFDSENYGFIKGHAFLKRLGVIKDSTDDDTISASNEEMSIDENTSQHIPYANVNNSFELKGSSRRTQLRSRNSSRAEKKSKNPIENWLKTRFRDGFTKIKSSFEDIDRQKTGQVRRDQFLNVLNQHNFKLESNLLDAFLERCDIRVPGSQYNNSMLISYTDFLEKFQNRSDQGLAYRMITHGDMSDSKSTSTLGLVEGKLLRLFQNDFLTMLQVFRKIDRNKTNSLNRQEFRAAIESHFNIELTDSEYEEFYSELPKDNLNKVKYLEFMTRFDTDSSSTLFDKNSIATEDFRPKITKRREYEPIIEENEETGVRQRSVETLTKIVKDIVRNKYKLVEECWNHIDVTNCNEMNRDMMWKLFKRIPIIPVITRDEVASLWDSLKENNLKDNKRLAYWQFVRHFGYSKESAAFTNSKKSPPKKGDNDMMLTSNKLGRDSILIRGSVQSKLNLLHDVLNRSFQDMDPHKTKYLFLDEFEEILWEICPELNDEEMNYIYQKHGSKYNKRINYIEFLAPYAKQENTNEKTNNSDILIKRNNNADPSCRMDNFDPIIQKVRSDLYDKHKDLRLLFKQYDYKQCGYVNINAFKEALKTAGCLLNKDELFTLLRILNKDISGMINYNRFINEIVKS